MSIAHRILLATIALLVASASYGKTYYIGDFAGADEVPPSGSPAMGAAAVTLDGALLSVDVTFSGLAAPAAAAHIHCCIPPGSNVGVAVPFLGFPSTTSGTYTSSFDLNDSAIYTSSFLIANGGTTAGAEAALVKGLANGMVYVNIHDSVFPGGEIRAQLVPRDIFIDGFDGN